MPIISKNVAMDDGCADDPFGTVEDEDRVSEHLGRLVAVYRSYGHALLVLRVLRLGKGRRLPWFALAAGSRRSGYGGTTSVEEAIPATVRSSGISDRWPRCASIITSHRGVARAAGSCMARSDFRHGAGQHSKPVWPRSTETHERSIPATATLGWSPSRRSTAHDS
jgi:hypothetical protein